MYKTTKAYQVRMTVCKHKFIYGKNHHPKEQIRVVSISKESFIPAIIREKRKFKI